MRTPRLPLLALLGAVVAMAAAAGALASTDLGGGPTVDSNGTVSVTPSLDEQRPPGPSNGTTTPGLETAGETPCGLTCEGPTARSLLSTLSTPSPLALAALLVALGLAAVVRFRGRGERSALGDDDSPAPAVPEQSGGTDSTAAGYDPPPADPAVRHWRRLTEAVDAEDPPSTTPREYERLAVAASHDPEAVATLTAAFEGVRYGSGARVDPSRIRAAAATLGLREGEQ